MKNVLIVDDSPMVRDIIGTAVKVLGYGLIYAEDGMQALEMLPHASIDVVITDLNMPKIDGVELIRQIKDNPLFSHIKFVAISSVEDLNIFKTYREVGVDAYIIKPFSSKKIIRVLKKLLENN